MRGEKRIGIPTVYRGVRFRSRLEAKWAAFFDIFRWKWEYEPFDLDGWIPDFALNNAHEVLVEVKPTCSIDGFDIPKMFNAVLDSTKEGLDLLLLGQTLVSPSPWDDEVELGIGWLGEWPNWSGNDGILKGAHGKGPIVKGWWFGRAVMMQDDGIGFSHEEANRWNRITGEEDKSEEGDLHRYYPDGEALQRLWGHAGATVQWRGQV